MTAMAPWPTATRLADSALLGIVAFVVRRPASHARTGPARGGALAIGGRCDASGRVDRWALRQGRCGRQGGYRRETTCTSPAKHREAGAASMTTAASESAAAQPE